MAPDPSPHWVPIVYRVPATSFRITSGFYRLLPRSMLILGVCQEFRVRVSGPVTHVS